MRRLNYELVQLTRRNRDGAYATQNNRSRSLQLIARQLHNLSYTKMGAQDLKGRHVNALVSLWSRSSISAATIKNRMAHLRWWAEKVGKQSVLHRDNSAYGIPDRNYQSESNKARSITPDDLLRVKDHYVRMSLELQQAFGLRREEAIKFIPVYADQGDYLRLKGSWTKGGKPRAIPIVTGEQRDVLDRAHALAGKGSLIPDDKRYVQQLKIYERHCASNKLSKMHGLRHAYAQQRYRDLTGQEPPICRGGYTRLSANERASDLAVRLQISKELGHEREQITAIYLGR